jgi:hypothetical protein
VHDEVANACCQSVSFLLAHSDLYLMYIIIEGCNSGEH